MVDNDDLFVSVIDGLVTQLIREIEDWREDILDYDINDAAKCFTKFIAYRVVDMCNNTYSPEEEDDYDQVVEDQYDIAEVIWKYTSKFYKLK